jgi:GrpB-like predicted nucleotidyltransferase (UPF0157 family)
MKKTLAELTLEELWQLFPIFLTEHKKEWKVFYCEEEKRLEQFLPMEQIARISHIGSTALETIWAKPTVDILVEAKENSDFQALKSCMIHHGYVCMCESVNRVSFNKGYTIDGYEERVFHLHMRHIGDNDELYFRDYLIEYPEIAKEYESLKLNLWKQYENDRDAYTARKTDMVKHYTEIAKERYKNRYC